MDSKGMGVINANPLHINHISFNYFCYTNKLIMTYISIDTKTMQAKKFVELVETMPFAKILKEPNAVTKKAMNDVRKGKSTKHKNAEALIAFLDK